MKKNLFKLSVFLVAAAMVFSNGCKKDVRQPPSPPTKNISSSTPIPDGYTMTMVGLMPNSNITVIEEGYKLSFVNGHAYKMHIASGRMVKDLGKVMPNIVNKAGSNLITQPGKNLNASARDVVFGNSGQTSPWVTYSEWQNTSGTPITNFTTNWTVPNAPTGNTGQLFAIWMGLMPTDSAYPSPLGQQYPLIQPLLIWGNSGGTIGGGQYWTIVSYIVWKDASNNLIAAISTPVHNIAVGTPLQAQISSTSQQPDHSYNCTSGFVGYAGLTITENSPLNQNGGGTVLVPFIPALNYACEVVEIPGAPYITSLNQYPNQVGVDMNSIGVTTGTTHPTVNWISSSASGLLNGATLGEHTNIVNGSEVFLDFQSTPAPSFLYWTPDAFTVNTAITPLSPSISGSTPIRYLSPTSPALPAGVSISTSNGVISGTGTALSAAQNYTVTAIGPGGSIGTSVVNLAIVNGARSFLVTTNSSPSIFFQIGVNGGPLSATYRVGQGQPSQGVNMPCTILSNSTVVMYIPEAGGIIPTSFALYNLGAPVYGTISGRTITFSNVNLTAGTSCQIVVN